MNTKYNGWTNYATWRINLEMFDGMEADEFGDDADTVADAMRCYAEEALLEDNSDYFVLLRNGIIASFLSEVNWKEIAQHKIEEYADEVSA